MATLTFKKPMLAKNYDEHRARVQYPFFVQPKLDGIRCITDGVTFWSRNGLKFSSWNMHHLRRPRYKFLVDGELMVREGGDFEDLSSIVRRHKHLACEDLVLNVFDVMTNKPFVDRLEFTRILFDDIEEDEPWECVPTTRIKSEKQLEWAHKQHLEWGYEGTMIRTYQGLYVPRKTADLLKYKPLKDAEFEIVDVIQAQGKDRGTPIFKCWTGKGRIDDIKRWFNVRPMGTMKQRRKMWRDRKSIPGEMLTVEFQDYTKYGKPRFPRAKVLRNYE